MQEKIKNYPKNRVLKRKRDKLEAWNTYADAEKDTVLKPSANDMDVDEKSDSDHKDNYNKNLSEIQSLLETTTVQFQSALNIIINTPWNSIQDISDANRREEM